MQELSGRAAWELGVRLTESGDLVEPDMIRHMTLDHVEAVFHEAPPSWSPRWCGPTSTTLAHRCPRGSRCPTGASRSVPNAIAKSAVAQVPAEARDAVLSPTTPTTPSGTVLVTTTLTPGLGPLLTRLNGIVAETGSVLAHPPILAREAGVPTVVGYTNVVQDLPEGAEVIVDGETGRVTLVTEEVSA